MYGRKELDTDFQWVSLEIPIVCRQKYPIYQVNQEDCLEHCLMEVEEETRVFVH